MKLATEAGFAVMGGMTIFSFLYGAQPGHIVRYITILLFMTMSILILLNGYDYFYGPWYRLCFTSVFVSIVVVSTKFRKIFMNEYNKYGQVNYFDKYFHDN